MKLKDFSFNDIIIKLLFLFILVFITISSMMMISGGVTDDTYNYIKSSIALPFLKTSVFPFGYPLVIKSISYLVDDYFFSTRIAAILGFCSIGILAFHFKFFVKETILVLGMKIFTIFLYAVSETLFLPLFYGFIIGINYILEDKNKFLSIIACSILLTSLFAIRYSGLFVWGALAVFFVVRIIFVKKQDFQVKRSILKVLLFSLIDITVILIYNYYYTDAFFGENNRSYTKAENLFDFRFFLKSIIFSFLMAGNPITDAVRINSLTFYLSILISILFWCFIIYSLWTNRKKIFRNQLLVFLLITAIVYFFGILYSSYATGIDGLHLRLTLPIIFCLFFILVINQKNFKFFLSISILSVVFNFLILQSEKFDYFEKKIEVTKYLNQKDHLKYYYNDVGIIPTETGGTKTSNFFTLFNLNPQVINLSDDEFLMTSKDSVVLESEMVIVQPINRTHMINNKKFTED